MKALLNVLAVCCLAAIVGCSTTPNAAAVNPGAVDADQPACSAASECSSAKQCPYSADQADDAPNMGAVDTAPSCGSASSCSSAAAPACSSAAPACSSSKSQGSDG